MLHAVIMAGGSGTRFWPLSRHKLPKQFLKLFGERSLLQQTVDRIADLVGTGGLQILTNQVQAAQTREQLPNLPTDRIIGEPCGRDTAPCIGLAAALLVREDPEARMLVLAADHLIQPIEKFHEAVLTADRFVEANPRALVTFGIPPTNPATGYGYLRRDRPAQTGQGPTVHKLLSFHEKPDLATAERFLASGEYYWNSGIFCWRASTILEELERNAPEMHQAVLRIAKAWNTSQKDYIFQMEYSALKKISIDYAVMERSQEVYMVEAPFQWDDVGSWLALERVLPADEAGNVVIGDHHGLRTNDCIVVGEKKHLIATIGVKDLIIVHTNDVTLIADRGDEQSVKELLANLEKAGRRDVL